MPSARKVSAAVLAIAVLLLLPSSVLASSQPTENAPALFGASHAPINIQNNTDLLAQAAEEGWPGTGTASDPIVIAGMSIITEAWPAAVYVQRTSLYLVLRDCVLSSTAVNGNATALLEVSHLTIRNVTASGYVALLGFDCRDILVANCTLRGSTQAGNLGEPSPIFFDTVTDIRITGTQFEEAGFTRSYFHAGENVVIDNSTVISTSLSIIGCHNTLVADSTFLESQTFGLYLLGDEETTVARNHFHNGSTGLFIYEGGGLLTRNIVMMENTFENVGVNFEGSAQTLETTSSRNDLVNGQPLVILKDLDLHGGDLPTAGNEYLLLRVSNGTISQLDIHGGNAALFLVDCQRLALRNCTFSDIYGYGIGLTNTDDVAISGCVFNRINLPIFSMVDSFQLRNERTKITQCHFLACDEAITDTAGLDWVIADNRFAGPGSFGITISSVTGTSIINNSFLDLSAVAIGLSSVSPVGEDDSSGVHIAGNSIVRCSGISLVGIRDSLLDNNTIVASPSTGIILYALVSNVTMTRNRIENCTSYGIWIKVAAEPNLDNTVVSNILIGNNGAGTAYHPSHIQAMDERSCRTQWSVPTAEGRHGNYWSDLTGPDVNHTGFVDVPYVIAEHVSDARPYASVVPYQATTVIGTFANDKVELTWAAPMFQGISPLTGYLVEKKVNGGAWKIVAITPSTTYVDANVSRGNDYQYSISAVNELGSGEGSVPITVNVRLNDWSLLYLILAIVVIVGAWGLVVAIRKR